MMCKRLFRHILIYANYVKLKSNSDLTSRHIRKIHLSEVLKEDSKKDDVKAIAIKSSVFEQVASKDKDTYLELVEMFVKRDVHRRGHVEFIYAALRNMKEFNVHKDLEVYKSLIDVLPKGKFLPQNVIQAEFMHYPKQQQCIIDLLEQMEDNGVMPDVEMEDMLVNIFGKRGFPVRKYWRMMYWMPKFKNLSPWPLPRPVPDDSFELAKLAIARISSVDIQAKLTIYQTKDITDSIDDTWIVSSQSPIQKRLLSEHDKKEPIYVEGAFRVWLREKPVNYFILRANAKPVIEEIEDPDDVSNIEVPFFTLKPPKKKVTLLKEIHEQNDGTIFALCATGTSSKDSLLSWIRHLEKDGNPSLAVIPIVFTLRSPTKEIDVVKSAESNEVAEHR